MGNEVDRIGPIELIQQIELIELLEKWISSRMPKV